MNAKWLGFSKFLYLAWHAVANFRHIPMLVHTMDSDGQLQALAKDAADINKAAQIAREAKGRGMLNFPGSRSTT